MILHELYFDGVGPAASPTAPSGKRSPATSGASGAGRGSWSRLRCRRREVRRRVHGEHSAATPCRVSISSARDEHVSARVVADFRRVLVITFPTCSPCCRLKPFAL